MGLCTDNTLEIFQDWRESSGISGYIFNSLRKAQPLSSSVFTSLHSQHPDHVILLHSTWRTVVMIMQSQSPKRSWFFEPSGSTLPNWVNGQARAKDNLPLVAVQPQYHFRGISWHARVFRSGSESTNWGLERLEEVDADLFLTFLAPDEGGDDDIAP